jgi:hypothetical protein
MSLFKSTLWTFAIAAVLVAPRITAQSAGSLQGRILDQTGAAIPRARVSLTSTASEPITLRADAQGIYHFPDLAAGVYAIFVVADGFAEAKQQVRILPATAQRLNIVLRVRVQHESVVVRDHGGLSISPAQNLGSVTVAGRTLAALADSPDELRADLQALARPAAGPNGSTFYVDGFTANRLPPKSAISAVTVDQNPFSAEYDQPGFGRVEVVTKPATDRFHGQISLNVNSSALNARNPFASETPDYHSELFEGSFGGPLGKRASFLLNAQHNRIMDVAVVSAAVLDSMVAPVTFNQAILNPTRQTAVSTRLDYQLASNDLLNLRYQFDTTKDVNAGIGEFSLPSQAYNSQVTAHTFQLTNQHVWSANTMNETRFQYQRERGSDVPQDLSATISVLGAFTGGGNARGQSGGHTGRYEFQNNTSINHGAHQLRFGGRVRAVRLATDSTRNFNGNFTFDSLSAYRQTLLGLQKNWTVAQIRAAGGGASQFSITSGQPNATLDVVDAAVYGQDDWRIRPNLSISYGLRFETQTSIDDHFDLAPRIAVAWGLGPASDSPKTVIRGGFGIFYDRIGEDLLIQTQRLNGSIQRQIIVTAPDFFPDVPALSSLQGTLVSPTIYQIDPNLHAPLMVQSAATVERQFSNALTGSITYTHTRGFDQLLSRNINAPLPGTYNPDDPASGVRPFGNVGNVFQYESRGVLNQDQIITNVKLRAAAKLSLDATYALNYAKGNTAGPSTSPSNQYDLLADYGRSAFDVRHQLSLVGNVELPHAVQVSPFLIAQSGTPFNITLGRDVSGDSLFNARPAFATDLSRPSVVITRWGAFDTAPLAGQKIIPSNYASGPAQFTLNLRVSKTIVLGGETGLTLSASARNLLNHLNVATPIGNLNSPLFGQSNQIAGDLLGSTSANRRIDLQVLFAF